jgi:flagellar basal-body rod protein FlgC
MHIGNYAVSAMNAFSVDIMAQANNIANVNTPGFKSQRVDLMSGPQDLGVMVGAVMRDTTPGPVIPDYIRSNDILAPAWLEGSNTDIAREFVRMMVAQNAYEANAAVIRAQDDLSGTLMDMMV